MLARWFRKAGVYPGDTAEEALAAAAAAILYEVAISDFHVAPEELAVMQTTLAEVLGLDVAAAGELLEQVAASARDTTSLHPFTRTINEALDAEGKQRLIAALWRVAYADGRIDRYEEHYLRKIADLLYIPHSAWIRAKLEVAGKR